MQMSRLPFPSIFLQLLPGTELVIRCLGCLQLETNMWLNMCFNKKNRGETNSTETQVLKPCLKKHVLTNRLQTWW